MYGYIAPCREELRVREEMEYKAWYCGLCRCLGRRCGVSARLALSYDCAFVALLLSGVSGEAELKAAICPFKPWKKRPMADGGVSLDFAADLDILLAWHKLADDWRDERRLQAPLGKALLHGAAQKAKRGAPALSEVIAKGIQALTELEKQNCAELDAAADVFACMLRQIGELAPVNGQGKRILPHVLYHMGRWVYLMDAWADRAKDQKSGSYNPFLASGAGKERAEFLLALSLNQACAAYELLRVEAHKGLLDNILFEGCAARMRGVLAEVEDEQPI